MPSLYGTSTSYTVTASNLIGLYQVSTSTAVITATTYSTNLVGLYGGSYAPLPTNAQQLINLFDNSGNVNFYLDPVTNSTTIYANFIGTITSGVNSLTAGSGISVSTSSGNVTIGNTGVLSITAGTNTNVSTSTGNITIWTSGGGSTFDISTWTNQRLFTTSSVAFNQIAITGTNIATTVSAVSVNLSGVDTITPQNNTSIWAVNRPSGVSRFLFDTYINPDGSGLFQDRSFITGRRARGTASAPTAVQNGDVLMRINAFGYATTQFLNTASAGINFTAAENFTDSATGGKISFDVLSTGTISSQTTIMIIDQTGVEIRNKNLSVTGGGDIILSTGSTVTFGDGTIQTTAFTGTVAGGVTSITAGTNTNVSSTTGNITIWTSGGSTFDISTWTNQRLFTTSSVSFAQLTITGTNIASTQSAILVNLSGSDVYPNPGDAGYGIWQINKPGAGSNQVNDTYGDNNLLGQFSRYTGRRARGTAASPTAVQLEDVLAQFQSNGFGTTEFSNTATGRLRFDATENFTDTARGTRFQIWANRDGEVEPRVLTSFRESGMFLYTTGTTASSMFTVVGPGYESPFLYAGDGTLIQGVNKAGLPARLALDTYMDNVASGADRSLFSGRRARGTNDAPTAVQTDDVLFRLNSFGYATTKFLNTSSAGINFLAAENFTDTAAGGKISFDVMLIGGSTQPSQRRIMLIDQTGVSIPGGYNLTLSGGGDIFLGTGSNITFPDATVQTTAWTGSNFVSGITAGSGISISTSTGAVTVSNTGVLSLTAGTGTNISTATGSVTIWTTPATPFDISTWTNQRLFTTSTVQFSGMYLTTGTEVDQVVSAGGYPLDGNGQALLSQGSTQSVAIIASNYTAGIRPEIRIRGYGQNMPGGTASTVPSAGLLLDGARGTPAAPTATQNGDTLGSLSFGGYDGANWLTNNGTGGPNGFAPGQQFYLATEAWANNGSTTTNAGTRLLMRVQPQGAQVNATSRQYHYIQTWTAGNTLTNVPPTLNIFQGTADSTLPNLTPSGGVGSFGTGFGATFIYDTNVFNVITGVVSQDAAPDNITLLGTNFITINGNRRSGVTGRRNALLTNDTVGGIQFNAQIGTSSTNIGSNVGSIFMSMSENATSTARGTNLQFYTTNLTTTTQGQRLVLSSPSNYYYSTNHSFQSNGATQSFVEINSNGVQFRGYTETVATAAFTATFAPNVSTATIFRMTLTNNITFNGFTSPVAGQSASVFFTQDATGSRLLTSTMKFAGGSKTLSTAGTSTDMISVTYDGNNYYASLVKGFV